MQEIQKIELPSARIFNAAFLLSVVLLSVFPQGTNTIGLVGLIWGVLALMRSAWFMETLFKTQRGTVRSRLLPWIILSGMERRQRTIMAKRAYRIFNGAFFYWFVCAGLYTLTMILGTIKPDLTLAEQNAAPLIAEFFQTQGITGDTHDAAHVQNMLMALGLHVVIGLAFFMAHSFAYTSHKSRKLWLGPVTLFVVMLIAYGVLYEFQSLSWPSGAVLYMVLAGAVPGFIFARIAWRSRSVRRRYAALGLFCLAAMLLSNMVIALPPTAGVLWLCGWVSVSVLWVRALGDESKKYMLYQMQPVKTKK